MKNINGHRLMCPMCFINVTANARRFNPNPRLIVEFYLIGPKLNSIVHITNTVKGNLRMSQIHTHPHTRSDWRKYLQYPWSGETASVLLLLTSAYNTWNDVTLGLDSGGRKKKRKRRSSVQFPLQYRRLVKVNT